MKEHQQDVASTLAKARLKDLIKLMRPHQWWKNGFVLIGLFFGHFWTDTNIAIRVFCATVAFSFISSAVYVVNDIIDIESDRRHPKKRFRPIAAGRVSTAAGWRLASFLAIAGTALAAWASWVVLSIIFLYVIMNVAYSIRLKHVVILDAFVISAGFILRVLAGTVGVGIPPSQWLLQCTIMVTLFLAFTKRRAEFLVMEKNPGQGRKVLAQYTPSLLDNLISITAAGTILSYSLYTTAPETVQIHQTDQLIATVPFVTYGIFRYMYLLHKWQAGENPAQDLLGDKHIIGTAVAWIVVTLLLIF